MLRTLKIRTFKTLESVTFDLGLVNVFIGANGSGKSNLLEAIGVLSAAANGQVNDQSLLARGVRPGLPALYKTAFPSRKKLPPHLFFGATSENARYEVSLHNPLKDPSPAWKFKTELWESNGQKIVGRSPAQAEKTNPERGLAALKAVEVPDGPGIELLNALQGFVIYSPTTPVLRGVDPERQPRNPVGLSGGQLPQAVSELLRQRKKQGGNPELTKQICSDALALIDWAAAYGSSDSKKMSLSPAAAAAGRVIHFRDLFMRSGRNLLSGYDASEGALYVLFLAVIAGHDESPQICAIDNADHGLNPRLARALINRLCDWYIKADRRQLLLTTHNPLVLDGLPLQDDRVRLFTVSRTNTGRTTVRRIEVNEELLEKAKQGWTLSRLWVMGHLGGVPDV